MHEDYKDYAIGLVCRNFDVEKDDLLGGKRSEEVVDARCALVHMLAFQGMRPVTIEKWTGVGGNSQSYLLQCYEYRWQSNPWFRHQMIDLIRDAKKTCPIRFKAHNKDGEVVEHDGICE